MHVETAFHLNRLIQSIREHKGVKAAVSLNPATPLSVLDYILPDLDMVLIMSVNPGFGGQSFIPSAMDKIRQLRKRIDELGLTIEIEVDGGVKPENAVADRQRRRRYPRGGFSGLRHKGLCRGDQGNTRRMTII